MGEKILFNGLVPQAPEEAMLERVERPRAWEYYLTAYLFQQQVRDRAEDIEGIRNEFFQRGQFVPSPEEAASLCQRELAAMLHISTSFDTLLRADLFEKAWRVRASRPIRRRLTTWGGDSARSSKISSTSRRESGPILRVTKELFEYLTI